MYSKNTQGRKETKGNRPQSLYKATETLGGGEGRKHAGIVVYTQNIVALETGSIKYILCVSVILRAVSIACDIALVLLKVTVTLSLKGVGA